MAPEAKPFNIRLNTILVLCLGIVIGVASFYFIDLKLSTLSNQKETQAKSDEPLYWVAPMDPNYRRDKPGKSPMGMDLIPVYQEADKNRSLGVVSISATMSNNIAVKTIPVEQRVIAPTIEVIGTLKYSDDDVVHVHPRIAGWVERLYIKAKGDRVQKGQVLYELYSPELVNIQEEYLLSLQGNDSALIKASERKLRAFNVPESSIDEIRQSRKVKQTIAFSSPQDGVVENLNIREGYFVELGKTLFSIADLSKLWLELELLPQQASGITTGSHVHYNFDYLSNKQFHGVIDYIYPSADTNSKALVARVRIDNNDKQLKANMFANAQIVISKVDAGITVPVSAVIRLADSNRVVVALADGEFKSVNVELGVTDDKYVEVLSGLADNDKVVVAGQFLIDSESSKTSDFLRFSQPEEEVKSVWVAATIKAVDRETRVVNARHDPIEEWGWPEMVMDFNVVDDLDLSPLGAGTSLHLEITKQVNGEYVVSNIHIMDGHNMADAEPSSATVTGVINQYDANTGIANISRGPIAKWQREAATMDFLIHEDIRENIPEVGREFTFTFEIHEGEFVVVAFEHAATQQHMHH